MSMRNKLIAVAFAITLMTVAKTASAQVTKFWYDAGTGNVTLRHIGTDPLKTIGGIQLKGPNLDLDPAPDALGGFVDTSIAGEVSWLFFTAKTGADVNLGNLFPTGLTKAQIDADYFGGVVYAGGGDPTPIGLPIAVPEPATIAMAGLAMVGCLAARRRIKA